MAALNPSKLNVPKDALKALWKSISISMGIRIDPWMFSVELFDRLLLGFESPMFMVAQPGDFNWCDGCGECSDEEMKKYPLEICEVCDKLVCSRCTHSNCGPLEHFD